ncbi:MAG: CRISPR-associated protein Csx15 [Anaerolineae bacterium]|nr:CRISPR-associated protein Csx15 [Anaerolineae bacterium]MDW8068804.1 CRISPR-associated protein Csx15 [Anaerolineae bacterium]
MILLNFSHPLTHEHIDQIQRLTGQQVERAIEIHSQIDPQQPLTPQVVALVNQCGLTPAEWQTLPLLVNPPSLNFIAVVLLAELHGRCGYFPAHLRLRPRAGSIPPQYEVAEILDLQAVRDAARRRR